MFIPKKMIPSGKRILITVDYIRTGRIADALINLAEMANCKVVGIFSLVTINKEWETKNRLMDLKKENKMWSVYNLEM
jgi:adenine/guanine phosphoribosyltransferase-like PRPP-binding protein